MPKTQHHLLILATLLTKSINSNYHYGHSKEVRRLQKNHATICSQHVHFQLQIIFDLTPQKGSFNKAKSRILRQGRIYNQILQERQSSVNQLILRHVETSIWYTRNSSTINELVVCPLMPKRVGYVTKTSMWKWLMVRRWLINKYEHDGSTRWFTKINYLFGP